MFLLQTYLYSIGTVHEIVSHFCVYHILHFGARKLLGQLVPYQYNFPPFSSFVDGKHLGLNLVSLWKCYM